MGVTVADLCYVANKGVVGQKYVKTCHEGGLVAKNVWRLIDLEPRFLKLALLFEICGFKNCKIGSEVVNISVGHPVYPSFLQILM